MIGVSFWLTETKPHFASALTTDELLRAYIEQDTDQDGLPDWQEEVYGTDPANAESVEKGMTDKEAVADGLVTPPFVSEKAPDPNAKLDVPIDDPAPKSLTKRFSEQFIQAYLAAGGGKNVSEEEQAAIINRLIEIFAQESEAEFASSYTKISLKMGSSADDMAYVEQVENLLYELLPKENSDMPALANALIEKGDAKAGKRLSELSYIYGTVTAQLLRISVPPQLTDSHLLLVRAYDSVSRAGAVLANYEADPISALGALSVFVPARDDIVSAMKGLAGAVLSHGEPKEGEPGWLSVGFSRQSEQQ